MRLEEERGHPEFRQHATVVGRILGGLEGDALAGLGGGHRRDGDREALQVALEAAEVGRKLKELEGPYKRAQEWKAAREDLDAARNDADLKELVQELEERTARLEEELRLSMVQSDPGRNPPSRCSCSRALGSSRQAGAFDGSMECELLLLRPV